MGEAAAVAAAEGLTQRRIEFHAAMRPHAAAAPAAGGSGVFRPERLRPDDDKRVWEKGEASGSGFDRELTAARIYLRRIGAGLRNLGNMCYLNSVLQCLTYTEPFVAYLQSGKHKNSCRTAGFCALCALQNHVRCALQSTGKILTPMQFVKNLRCISCSFRNYRQEDAHELMVNLLESMHKCCLPSGIPSQSPSAYERSLVHRIFGGRLRSQVRCTRCSHCSNKFDPFLDLSLEIANAPSLVKALHNFTEEELLDGGEKQYNCQRCRQKVVGKKRFTIDKAPDVLTIHLKRFSPFNPREKIDKKVDFQPTLNLKPFVSSSEGMDFKYILYGVLVHAGWNTQSGHYYCFVRTSSGIWHNLDDNRVHQVREADVLRQKAYMLFYVRDRVMNSLMRKDGGAADLPEKNIISEKITSMSGSMRNGLIETTLNVSSFINGDIKLQKQNSDNIQPSIIGNISPDQCSKNHSSTEVIESAGSQNSGTVSVQNVPCNLPGAAATLSTAANKTTLDSEITSPLKPDQKAHDASCEQKAHEKPFHEQQLKPDGALTDLVVTLNSQNEITAPPKPDASILHDARCDQKANENPILHVQQLGPGGAFDDFGTGTTASFPVCNGADELWSANGQAPEPETPFCKPTLHKSNTPADGQIIQNMDIAVSTRTICSREDLTCCCEDKKSTEPVKQHDVLVTLTELSAKEAAGIPNIDDQTSVQTNTLAIGKAPLELLSVKDPDHIAIADEQASVQNNEPTVLHGNSEEQISSEDAPIVCPEVSTQAISEDSTHVICSEDSAQVLDKDRCHGNLHKKMDFKSKKNVKIPVLPFLFGFKRLFLTLKLHKKRKHRRTRRQTTSSMDTESTIDDQQASTSETVLTNDISSKSHRRKRPHPSASSNNCDKMVNKKQHLSGDSTSAADLPVEKKDNKDAKLTVGDLPSSVANDRAPRHFDILTRGLREITVPRWDAIDMPITKGAELQYKSTNSIGYVLDEWDEVYDRGRKKKVRKTREEFSGLNPFQETADVRSRSRK